MRQQERHGADMVFVAVRQHNRANLSRFSSRNAKSGVTISTPRSSASGNIMPASMRRYRRHSAAPQVHPELAETAQRDDL